MAIPGGTKKAVRPSRKTSPRKTRKAVLGSGMAGKAEKAMKSRKKRLDDAIKKAGG